MLQLEANNNSLSDTLYKDMLYKQQIHGYHFDTLLKKIF